MTSASNQAKTLAEDMWRHMERIERYSRTPMRPMSLKKLEATNSYGPSAIIKNAEWVRHELPVRVAHRICDFHRLPHILLCNPFFRKTYDIYVRTFDRTSAYPAIETMEQEREFEKLIQEERSEHDRTVEYIGQGMRQIKRVCPEISLNEFLERFFLFRISRRIMIEHLIALHRPVTGWAGCVYLECKPVEIIKARAEDVRESCRMSYGVAPHYTLTGNLDTNLMFIPDHLALIITEVLKNAMRSTVEFHTLGNSIMDMSHIGLIAHDDDLPEVKIELYKGRHEILIKVSDRGGGIPPHKINDIWNYGYTTVNDSIKRMSERQGSLTGSFIRPDMAGYGFGLPLSRAFARYFGGDISLQSIFGVGTDAYITLNHVGDQEEALYFEERTDMGSIEASVLPSIK